MIASWSATCELAKLVVAHEPAFLRAELLDASEHVALRLLRQVEPQLGRLDPDRVEAALLAEHDAPLGGNELGRVGLDCGWIVELTRDRTGLAAKEVVADERLVGLELVSRQTAQPLGERTRAVETQLRLDAVEPT